MEQGPSLVSRRDVLKRGAVVGGTVLWVAPLVQTLGMGRAFAAATSSDPCALVLTITGCDSTRGTFFFFEVCTSPECTCGSTSLDHGILVYVDGVPRIQMNPDRRDPVPGCYTGSLFVTGPLSNIQARCVRKVDGSFIHSDIIVQSNVVQIAQEDIDACTA